MDLIFNHTEYQVYLGEGIMYFKPTNNERGRVLLLTPPGIKPQFYSIIAVVLSKAGVGVFMPTRPTPCNEESLKRACLRFVNSLKPDLTVSLGFRLGLDHEVSLGFTGDFLREQLSNALTPGSMHHVDPGVCGELIGKLTGGFHMVVSGLGVKELVGIKDLVLRALGSVKNKAH